MPLLLVKLIATPLLVGGASLASRRWGPAIGGWIVALPLTSGPVLLFLALEQGPPFAVAATTGTVLGLGAICAFCVGYLAASRAGPVLALAAASGAYAIAAVAVQPVIGLPFWVHVAGVVAAIAALLWILPPRSGSPVVRVHPAWDLPARIVTGTFLVVAFTAVAPLLGPTWSGLVTTFPVYVSVLAVFEHLRTGRDGALDVLRGLATGLFGTLAFYVVLRLLLEPVGVLPAFVGAVAVAGAAGAVSLRVDRSREADATGGAGPAPDPESV